MFHELTKVLVSASLLSAPASGFAQDSTLPDSAVSTPLMVSIDDGNFAVATRDWFPGNILKLRGKNYRLPVSIQKVSDPSVFRSYRTSTGSEMRYRGEGESETHVWESNSTKVCLGTPAQQQEFCKYIQAADTKARRIPPGFAYVPLKGGGILLKQLPSTFVVPYNHPNLFPGTSPLILDAEAVEKPLQITLDGITISVAPGDWVENKVLEVGGHPVLLPATLPASSFDAKTFKDFRSSEFGTMLYKGTGSDGKHYWESKSTKLFQSIHRSVNHQSCLAAQSKDQAKGNIPVGFRYAPKTGGRVVLRQP